MRYRIMAMAAAALVTSVVAARAGTIFDLKEPATDAGRRTYIDLVVPTMMEAIAGAVPCELRSADWAAQARLYTTARITGQPGETAAEVAYAQSSMKEAEVAELRHILRGPKAACAEIAKGAGLKAGDMIAARMKRLANAPDPWAGAGGK